MKQGVNEFLKLNNMKNILSIVLILSSLIIFGLIICSYEKEVKRKESLIESTKQLVTSCIAENESKDKLILALKNEVEAHKNLSIVYFGLGWQKGALASAKDFTYGIDMDAEYKRDSIKAFPSSIVHFSSD